MAATVLCVDNDRNLCQILAKALGEEGYRVLTAFDGEKALEMVADEAPDLVLLDLLLPRRDGFGVLGAIRALPEPACATPVVLITGCSPTPEYTRRAALLGAAALLAKPVPLDRLLAAVAQQIPEAKAPVPVDPGGLGKPGTGAAAEPTGTLDRLPFPALLHHLHGLRATGALHLASGRKRKWIQFREGYPVAVRSNLVNECLGNFLVRAGRITQSALEKSLLHVKAGQRQGEILVAMRVLSEQEMAAALRAQADEKLFEIFSWESGSFRFERGARLERANAFGVERSPANLILHGVRTRYPIARVRATLEAQGHCFAAPGQSPFYRFQEIDLDRAQMRLLGSLDGTRRLSEFLAEEDDVQRTLYALIATGLLELRAPGAAGRRAESPAAFPRPIREGPTPEEAERRARLAALADRLRRQSHWEVLGIDEAASDDEIRSAYERLAERTHPDRAAGSSAVIQRLAEEVFGRVSEAYQTLIDPRSRQQYVLEQKREERVAAQREESRQAVDAEMQFQRGDELLRQRDYPGALQHFGKALEIYPAEGEYHAHYGWALYLCHPGDASIVEEAMEHLRRGIKLASHREKPYLFMGRLCQATDRAEAAEKMFTRAVQIRPDCVEALRELRLLNMRREKARGLIGRLFRR